MLVSCFISVVNGQHGMQELALHNIISYVLGNLTYNAKCASCEFAVCCFVCKSIAMHSQ